MRGHAKGFSTSPRLPFAPQRREHRPQKQPWRSYIENHSEPRELPSGAFWLSKELTDHDVVYGQEFVLQRPKRGGPGLVRSDHNCSLAAKAVDNNFKLAVRDPQNCGTLAQHDSLWDVTDITEYTFLGEHGLLPGAKSPFLLPAGAMSVYPPPDTTSTGLILHPSSQRQPQEDPGPDKNPRRTKKVKFTCKLCETENIKRVSPHGWTSGSVFARCEGCQVVHKLVDNLKIFHEFQGSLFPRPTSPKIKIPEGLPQKPALDYHMHPAMYSQLPNLDSDPDREEG